MPNPISMFNFIPPILNCIPRAWTYTAELQQVDTKHRELTELKKQLYNLKESVISRVDVAKAQGQVIVPDVSVWLDDVKSKEEGLNEVLAQGSRLLNRSCLCALIPCGCWGSEMFLREVATEITLVTGLLNRRNFEVVSQSPPPASTVLQPEVPTVDFEVVFQNAWSFIEENESGIMGLYGMGGVGKTTLLIKMNNKFLVPGHHGFDVVIWVVISNNVDFRDVQNKIGKSLGLSWKESETVASCASDIYNRLISKQFVVLLDDIWRQIDLSIIGIPHPNDPHSASKCKVVFTTRSYTVCGQMGADKKIKVECLNKVKAWELFRNNVRQNTLLDSDPEIRTLAESVANECDGLPLALIVTGRTMASKQTVEEWNHAVTTLRKHAAEFADMEDKVFSLLKFSYDNLPDHAIRSCFLFCSLYPEDHRIPIEALIQQWIGEGYMDKFGDWQEAIHKGHEKIGILKATCLLESDTKSPDLYVKMHDVIRDMAHWVACVCGDDKDKIFVKKGGQITEAHEDGEWAKAQTISLWNTEIIPPYIPNCPRLDTLLLIRSQFRHISENIFLSMPALRVLDFSGVIKRRLPRSIGKLVKLEYLDISGLGFDDGDLPVEMKNLVSLKYLFLGEHTKIPVGVIKKLLNLRTLKLSISSFVGRKRSEGIQELELLPRLICIQVKISNLKDLQDFLSKDRLVSCTSDLTIKSQEIEEITSLVLSSSVYSSSCLNLGGMKNARKLQIGYCKKLNELVIDNSNEIPLFKSLVSLELFHLSELVVSWDGKNMHDSFFTKLHTIIITNCDSVVNLKWLCLAPRVQVLQVSTCARMERILVEEDSVACDENTFSRLKQLHLSGLPRLESICSSALPFLSLMEVVIYDCLKLRSLPLDSNSAQNVMQFIKGSSDWWNNLEWENESTKSTFTSFFRAS